MIRSFLFVPADSERKMQKAFVSGADALIFDLEDSVAANAKADARQLARENITNEIWVRINPLDTEEADLDLRSGDACRTGRHHFAQARKCRRCDRPCIPSRGT